MTTYAPHLDGVRLVEDIVFADVAGTQLCLDLVLPQHNDRPVPVAVYVHGGGWAEGGRRVDLARRIAPVARLGVGIVACDYRLGPAGRFPAAVQDVLRAVDWVRVHGAEHGLQTTRVGGWGSSAGAHLVLVAALDPAAAWHGDLGERTRHGATIDAVVNFFATSDLAAQAARNAMERRFVPPGPERGFLGLDDDCDEREMARRARAASPLAMVHAGAPPVLSVHGDRDQLVPFSHSQHLHDALVAAGARSTLVCLGGAGHEDPRFDQPAITSLVAQFLDDTLSPPCRSSAEPPR